jgi:DNA mismatch repair protein MSH3
MRFEATSSSKTKKGSDSNEQGQGEGDDDDDGAIDEEITFLYEVADGVAHRSYGLNVARLARIPRRVLDVAARKSREMEEGVKARRLRGAARLLEGVVRGGDGCGEEQLDHLVSSIEQL